MKKCGRNDPCPCGSGKKFKKCCEATMLGGRFKAQKVDTSAPAMASASRVTGFFKSQMENRPILSTDRKLGKRASSEANVPSEIAPPLSSLEPVPEPSAKRVEEKDEI